MKIKPVFINHDNLVKTLNVGWLSKKLHMQGTGITSLHASKHTKSHIFAPLTCTPSAQTVIDNLTQ